MKVLALIPARGGSKGILRKNLSPFLGRPLVEWSIIAARKAEMVTRVIVSTDDDEIAECAKKAGAEVPFMRPAELADDDTLDHPVFVHAIKWLLKNENFCPDLIVHLRPTSPLRPDGLIDEGIRSMVNDEQADSLRSVCEPDNNPFKMWKIDDVYMTPLVRIDCFEAFNQPRQSLPKTYWQTGTLDIVRPRTILELNGMSGNCVLPMVIDRNTAVDIDDEFSLRKAEELCRSFGMGGSV